MLRTEALLFPNLLGNRRRQRFQKTSISQVSSWQAQFPPFVPWPDLNTKIPCVTLPCQRKMEHLNLMEWFCNRSTINFLIQILRAQRKAPTERALIKHASRALFLLLYRSLELFVKDEVLVWSNLLWIYFLNWGDEVPGEEKWERDSICARTLAVHTVLQP